MQAQPILVVDDEPDMRMALTHSLSRSGYAVESASSGSEALGMFKKNNFSTVITDMKMPEMSGMELLGEVKKISPRIPVIMITAFGTINNAVEAMKKGASDFLIKPFSFNILETAVKKVHINSTAQPESKSYNGDSRIKQIISQDSKVLKILKLAKDVAPSNATVLIQGESGTGKEIVAFFIHQHSGQRDRPYVAVNCAALPDNLTESELFGHEKGAFTGAIRRKIGKFELANKGTIVLDEISEMSLPIQAKLLRVLQEREIDRVGGNRPVPIDSRIIAISNIDLKKAVKEGKFREDLFYRVNVIPITLPPLRERRGDIPLLVSHFLEKYSSKNNKKMKKIADETITLLSKYDWKGNVRELENTIERAVLLGKGDVFSPKHFLFEEPENDDMKNSVPIRVGQSVREMEKELIFQTLKEVNENRTRAAELLGISIRTLRNKLREYKMNN